MLKIDPGHWTPQYDQLITENGSILILLGCSGLIIKQSKFLLELFIFLVENEYIKKLINKYNMRNVYSGGGNFFHNKK